MDYQTAYFRLFNAVTDCIRLLQQAQQESEELACAEAAPPLSLVPEPPESEK